jgi:hypothetical protein
MVLSNNGQHEKVGVGAQDLACPISNDAMDNTGNEGSDFFYTSAFYF